MFYSESILSRKGPLAKVWLAAHWERKLSKSQLLQTNVNSSVEAIKGQVQGPLALRLSGQLLLGVVRIYSRKAKYLMDDCSEAIIKIKLAFRPAHVDLPAHEQHTIHPAAITLPEATSELDLMLPEPHLELQALLSHYALAQPRAHPLDELTQASLLAGSTPAAAGSLSAGSFLDAPSIERMRRLSGRHPYDEALSLAMAPSPRSSETAASAAGMDRDLSRLGGLLASPLRRLGERDKSRATGADANAPSDAEREIERARDAAGGGLPRFSLGGMADDYGLDLDFDLRAAGGPRLSELPGLTAENKENAQPGLAGADGGLDELLLDGSFALHDDDGGDMLHAMDAPSGFADGSERSFAMDRGVLDSPRAERRRAGRPDGAAARKRKLLVDAPTELTTRELEDQIHATDALVRSDGAVLAAMLAPPARRQRTAAATHAAACTAAYLSLAARLQDRAPALRAALHTNGLRDATAGVLTAAEEEDALRRHIDDGLHADDAGPAVRDGAAGPDGLDEQGGLMALDGIDGSDAPLDLGLDLAADAAADAMPVVADGTEDAPWVATQMAQMGSPPPLAPPAAAAPSQTDAATLRFLERAMAADGDAARTSFQKATARQPRDDRVRMFADVLALASQSRLRVHQTAPFAAIQLAAV